MATWIAHLRIAETLLERITDPSTGSHRPGVIPGGQRLDPGQFAIGNIAPDSGIPDEKWEKFEPPPQVTHFKRSKSVHKDIADLDFYRNYLADVSIKERLRFSFRLGYFFHLITDNLWTIEVGRPTSERWAEQFAADKKFIWEVKEDWYGLDQIYVREYPNCLFWSIFLNSEPTEADLDFLPPNALHRQLKHIKSFYQRDDDEIKAMMARPMIYLPKAKMDRFVEYATERIYTIYQLLWPTPPALDGKHSALEFAES